MSTQIQRRRGTTTEHASFTGALGETTVDTTKDTVVVHDGTTVGGHPLAKENLSNVPAGTITSTMIADGTIVNGDINASAAIAGTKISPDFGSQTITTTGVVSAALGAAATPSLTFTGDLNTGIYSPGADQVAISTNGSGRLFINSAGNTVIGSSTAQAFSGFTTLTVDNATNGGVLCINKNAVNMGNISAANDALTIDAANGGSSPIVFRTGAATTERVRITSAGNVGIGTSNPQVALQLGNYSGNNQLAITSGSASGTGALFFGDGTGTDLYRGYIQYYHVNDSIEIGTAATGRLTIDSSGRVGIGTTSPAEKFDVRRSGFGNVAFFADDSASGLFIKTASGVAGLDSRNNTTALNFLIDGSEKARLDTSGRLLVGTSSSYGVGSTAQAKFQASDTTSNIHASFTDWSTADSGGIIVLGKAKGGSAGNYTIVANGNVLGEIRFAGADGTDLETNGASIRAEVDGTPGSNDMPGRLVFSTTADGASSPTERGRFTSVGFFKCANSGTYLSSTGSYHEFDTNAADHTMRQQNTHGSSPYGLRIDYTSDPNNTGNEFLYLASATSTLRASIRSNGGLANYQTNNVNLSDINSKKDISPAAGTWDCIKEWEIVNYRYKDQPDDADLNLGVIAQQVAESCPEVIAVFQEAKEATEDQPAQEERLGVKEQQMYWMAIKALQEAQVRIEALEAEVAALKAE